ncbi:MAG TPA: YkgJ family cysteine cluster protein [Solimonas sp.]|nr:YkgJ family cysteine cluster protein [Solimonas sp.]
MSCHDRILGDLRRKIPSFQCVPGCHDCCGPVTASSIEMARLPVKGKAVHDAALADLSCPHLGAQGCEVYDERPLICRLFGTTPSLPCPNGRGPEVMTDPVVERQIHWFAETTRQVLV